MRHTFASWAIAAGLPTFEIAVTMGASLEQLSKTYGHLLPDSADRATVALDGDTGAVGNKKPRSCRAFRSSGRRDSNSGPLVPQACRTWRRVDAGALNGLLAGIMSIASVPPRTRFDGFGDHEATTGTLNSGLRFREQGG
jgi:hypothetical protein